MMLFVYSFLIFGVQDDKFPNIPPLYLKELPTVPSGIQLAAPILAPGDTGSWDDQWILDGHVILVHDTLKMWYLGINLNHNQYPCKGIGLAYSADSGKTWHKYSGNPVFFTDSTSRWERTTAHTDGLWEATVLYENNEYKMWYQAWDESDCFNTLFARSTDGIHWERGNNGTPVLYAGYYESGDTQWDSRYCGARSVMKVGALYYLFYEAESFYRLRSFNMGLAIGVSETTFAKVDTLHPVFTTIGTADTLWCGTSIIPNVILDSSTFILVYSSNSAHTYKTTTGLALSSDGIHWERYAQNPICNLASMGMPSGAITALHWEQGNQMVKELVAISRSIPKGIYSCQLPFLLRRP
ncbi:MAG: hypothetical protein HY769_01530 [Candidatus Stahlbacteria bacterium]|nr:hypothetical protein [Candidatus Stahlbacteria bacterium]